MSQFPTARQSLLAVAGGGYVSGVSVLASALAEGVLWFRRELRELVPRRVSEVLTQPPRVLMLLVGKSELELVLYESRLWGGSRRRTALGSGTWKDLEDLLRRQLRSWGWISNVEIAVPLDRCLVLDKRIPASATERSGDIMRLELQRSNPGGLEDIAFGHVVHGADPGDDLVRATCYVCKRSILSPISDQVATLNVVPAAIRVVSADGTVLDVNLKPAQSSMPPLSRLAKSASQLLGAILVTLFIAGAVTHKLRVEAEIADVHGVVEELQKQAKAKRLALSSAAQMNDGIASLRVRRIETPTILEIWEELTKILPGSAYAVEVRLEDAVITIDGSARSASELVALLSKSSFFQSVEFAAPVTRDAQKERERFQLRARLATGRARR